MKIDQQNLSGVNQNAAASGVGLNPAGASRSASVGDLGDQAELSGVSRVIQAYQTGTANRVSQLSAAVQSGSYNIDPALIAPNIVGEALSATASR